MRTYNCIFKLPKDEELFVAAYAAISSYERMLRSMKLPFQFFLITEESWLTDLVVSTMMFIVKDTSELTTHFDMAVDLRDDDAISIGKRGKHAVEAFGAMIGIADVSEIVAINQKVPNFDLLMIPWSEKSFELINNIKQRYPNVSISTSTLDSAKIVVGCRSIATYLAACANRSILELYALEEYPKEFLPKWSNPNYRMLCVEKKESLDKNHHIIWRALEQKLNVIQGQSRDKSI